MKNKYLFIHIPKAAGTSLFEVFKEVLGAENVRQVENLNNFRAVQAGRLREYALVGGHFVYSQASYFEKDRYKIVFLRNPVDRFLSHYYFYRNNSLDKTAVNLVLGDYVEFYKNQKFGGVNNMLTWFLTGLTDTTIPMDQLLSLAKENLAATDFAGIFEFFSESVDLLCLDCNWPPVTDIPIKNINYGRPGVPETDPEIVERIKELNKYDLLLYQYGLSLFEKKKRSILHKCARKNLIVESVSHTAPEENERCGEKPSPADLDRPLNFGSRQIEITGAEVVDPLSGLPAIKSGGEALIRIYFTSSISFDGLTVGFSIEDDYRQIIYGTNSFHLGEHISVLPGQSYCAEHRLHLNIGEGAYRINASLHTGPVHLENCFHWWEHISRFTVEGHHGPHSIGIAKLYPELSVIRGGSQK